jgi:Mg2+/Co2+ transporter CorB
MTTSVLILMVALLILSGIFAAAETALTAVSRGRMHQLEKEGSSRARSVNKLVSDRESLIGAILLGNTFLNILVSALATVVFTTLFGERGVFIATGVMTVVILVFVEVLPKTLAIVRTDMLALNIARPLRPIVSVLGPTVRAVQWFVWRVLGLFGVKEEEGEPLVPAHEEIRGTVDLHHIEGAVEREHRDMIGGVLDLVDLKIGDVMIHRKNMAAIDADQEPSALFDALLAANHSRVPVWRETPDNIIGILSTREVMREYARRGGSLRGFDILSLLSEPWFVPDTTTLEEQLQAFKERRTHFALVVDEYGTLQGVITLEDILQEILGEIPDEHAITGRPGIRPQPDGSFNIDGTIPVRDINRALEWNLPEDEATTLAGLVIHEARTIPEVGQRFAFYGFKFEVLRRQRNQITAVRVTPPAKTEPETIASANA